MAKRKDAKPATPAQKAARERNWNKGQVNCLIAQAHRIHKSETTQLSERLILSDIQYKLNKIIQNWNK